MIRAVVLYPAAPGHHFDFAYYLARHVPMARELLVPEGLVRLEVDRGASGEELGSPPRYVCMASMYFETLEDYERAMARHGESLGADVPNYTNVEPFVQVNEIIA